jgi:hypothetical protein
MFDLTRVRNLKKTSFFVFCRFFNFLHFHHAGVARTSRDHHTKCRANTILSFRRCFVSHDQCRREPQISFEVSLKGCLRNFLRVFFFFVDFVEQSNSWAKAVAHMIRLSFSDLTKIPMCVFLDLFKRLTNNQLDLCFLAFNSHQTLN